MKKKNKISSSFILPIILFITIVAAPFLSPSQEDNPSTSDSHPQLEIALDYQRQGGIASNQFAVWIEDASGALVKTLYATRFTATGGWQKRPACLPEWVTAAQPDALTSEAIDAISGATPSSGRLHFVWNGRDRDGKRVPPGSYRYVVEANLRWDKRVVYRGIIDLGGPSPTSRPEPKYFNDAGGERGMISDVVATYVP